MARMPSITLEDVRILFRNFAGNEGKFNRAGDRNFCLALDPRQAEEFARLGMNVKLLKPRDEEDEPQAYVQVKVNFGKGQPPKIVMVTSRGKTVLPENMVNVLDFAEIKQVDLIINPNPWEMPSGATGVSIYVKSMFVTIEEDELEKKYNDVPDSAMNTLIHDEGPPWSED